MKGMRFRYDLAPRHSLQIACTNIVLESLIFGDISDACDVSGGFPFLWRRCKRLSLHCHIYYYIFIVWKSVAAGGTTSFLWYCTLHVELQLNCECVLLNRLLTWLCMLVTGLYCIKVIRETVPRNNCSRCWPSSGGIHNYCRKLLHPLLYLPSL
jgi:hypothetical protein